MRTGKVARIADRVRKELGELTPQERDLAVKALRDALYEGFALDAATSDPNQMEACVRCGSIRIIRKGRGRDGSQRWKCMNCNRTFGVRTNRVMGMSKLKAGVWMRFLECFADCLSLRKCAQRCGVCLKTAFLMRQRVIECIRRTLPSCVPRPGRACSWTRRTSVRASKATIRSPPCSSCPARRASAPSH